VLQRLGLIVLLSSCGAAIESPPPGCESTLGARAFSEPRITPTDSPLDLAIAGAGFFELSDRGSIVYTRVGHFTLDDDGHLVGPGLYRLVGEPNDTVGVGELHVAPRVMAPKATTLVRIRANLDADASMKSYDPLDPVATSNAQSSVQVFTELGRAVTTDIFWTHTANGTWEFHAVVDGAVLTGGSSGFPTEVASGTLTFDTDGRLSSTSQTSNLNWLDSTSPVPLQFELGTPALSGGDGLDGVTQFAAASATWFTEANGFESGDLAFLVVEPSGRLVGHFTNGERLEYGRIVVARFEHPETLMQVGHSLLVPGLMTGAVTFSSAAIRGSALEAAPSEACR